MEMEKCGYCGRSMCGSATGSTGCEPDLYRASYSNEERKALKEDWGIEISSLPNNTHLSKGSSSQSWVIK